MIKKKKYSKKKVIMASLPSTTLSNLFLFTLELPQYFANQGYTGPGPGPFQTVTTLLYNQSGPQTINLYPYVNLSLQNTSSFLGKYKNLFTEYFYENPIQIANTTDPTFASTYNIFFVFACYSYSNSNAITINYNYTNNAIPYNSNMVVSNAPSSIQFTNLVSTTVNSTTFLSSSLQKGDNNFFLPAYYLSKYQVYETSVTINPVAPSVPYGFVFTNNKNTYFVFVIATPSSSSTGALIPFFIVPSLWAQMTSSTQNPDIQLLNSFVKSQLSNYSIVGIIEYDNNLLSGDTYNSENDEFCIGSFFYYT